MDKLETLLVERDGAVATITINRPDKLNALNARVLSEVHAVVRELEREGETRAAILTGAGDKAFAAGADIAAMVEMGVADAKAFSDLGHAAMAYMETVSFPILGAVNGFCLGGGLELALACDFLYASDKAKLGQPEVNLGVVPGFGGTQRLARRVGIARARELCFTADVLTAEQAKAIGLVNDVVPHAELLGKVREIAAKIATKGPLAVATCKRLINRGEGVPLVVANEMEAQAFGALFGTADRAEGMRAFVAKRPPAFVGK